MIKTFSKLWKYIKRYKIQLLFTLLLSSIIVFITLYIPIIVATAIDFIIDKGQVDFNAIYKALLKVGILASIAAVLQWVMNVINNNLTFYIVRDLRNDALLKLEKVPLKYIDTNLHGEIVSRVISDVDQIADGLLMGFTQVFSGILTILITIFFMFSINYKIALVVIVVTPLSIFIAKYISKKTYIMFKQQSEIRGEQTAFINEMIKNQKTVIAFNEQNNNIKKFKKLNDKLEETSLKAVFYSSITNPSTRFVNNIVYAGVALAGALTAISGSITVGGLSCFLNYANQYTKPFNEISGIITELQNAIACSERILKIIEEEPEIKEENKKLKNVKGRVEFKNVNFSYLHNKPLIKNLNINIEPGKKIAIVGPTGCGKTTLINLLMRFYDVNTGAILVDGIDIRKVTRNSLRSSFGMVLQDTWIKNGTVKENIKLGKENATDEEVIQASKDAMSYNFIKSLPNEFDTIVSENNGVLSEGEKQLISISRIMLLNPPMLILDEATSNIDTRTESKIQKAFDNLMEGRTSFIVAHRLSTIISADLILVMKDGNIIESGTHKQLIENKGFYSELYNSQFESSF